MGKLISQISNNNSNATFVIFWFILEFWARQSYPDEFVEIIFNNLL